MLYHLCYLNDIPISFLSMVRLHSYSSIYSLCLHICTQVDSFLECCPVINIIFSYIYPLIFNLKILSHIVCLPVGSALRFAHWSMDLIESLCWRYHNVGKRWWTWVLAIWLYNEPLQLSSGLAWLLSSAFSKDNAVIIIELIEIKHLAQSLPST